MLCTSNAFTRKTLASMTLDTPKSVNLGMNFVSTCDNKIFAGLLNNIIIILKIGYTYHYEQYRNCVMQREH